MYYGKRKKKNRSLWSNWRKEPFDMLVESYEQSRLWCFKLSCKAKKEEQVRSKQNHYSKVCRILKKRDYPGEPCYCASSVLGGWGFETYCSTIKMLYH